MGPANVTIKGGPVQREHLDEVKAAVQPGRRLDALWRADSLQVAIWCIQDRGPVARFMPSFFISAASPIVTPQIVPAGQHRTNRICGS